MFASVLSAAIFGMEVREIQVEADVSDGLPSFTMVGFPSAQVREAQERVRTAFKNNRLSLPPKRVTVNFAPADMKKEGAGFDLPVAAAVLAAAGILKPELLSRVLVVGEISLNGEIHGVSGILPRVIRARELGLRFCIIPEENIREGKLVRDMQVFGVKTLGDMIRCLKEPEAYLYTEEKEMDIQDDPTENRIDFADVCGQEGARRVAEIAVSGFHNILLIGPPGSGKTMLAKAVAGESNVPFFSMSGSEFVEMFVGMGASKVRDLFKQAKEKAPCIVFIDEIDAIGKKRDGQMAGGNDEREQTLNQLLTEMDGFEGNNGVIILAATNRPESLDPALTRPGRFDRRVPVELPDLEGREAILKVHAKKVQLSDDVDFHTIARMASGASGAELANIVNEAALRAVRDNREVVTEADLEESIEVVIAGYQKKNAVLSDQEKKVVAYHEIGHALVAAMQTHSAPVQKITIIPRTSGALGYTMQVEQGDKYLLTKKELENKIATFTGGRAAEEVVFGEVTTGASNDIEQATKIARSMITRYGMSDDFDMVAMETVTNQYLGGDASLACSADTQNEIDRQVVELVKREHEKAKKILMDNRQKLDELSNYLYEKETITGDEFMAILKGNEEKIEAKEDEHYEKTV